MSFMNSCKKSYNDLVTKDKKSRNLAYRDEFLMSGPVNKNKSQ